MKKYLSKIPTPLYLLFITVLAYGIYIPWFGFYGDDWSYIWYQHLLGFGGAGDFAAYDRPFSALYYNIVIALLGESVLPYQIFVLFLRWLSGVLLWLVLKQVWKNHPVEIFWTSTLFLIFPGFGQQPIAVEYILHFMVLDLFLLSLWGMNKSINSQKKKYLWLTAVSMLFSSSVFAIEYFFGLEVLRPIFIWMKLAENRLGWKQRLKKTVLYWLPYLAVILLFCFWRIFIFKFPTYGPGLLTEIRLHPVPALAGLLVRVAGDFKTILLDSWQAILRRPQNDLMLVYLSILAGSLVAGSLFYFTFLKKEDQLLRQRTETWQQSWSLQAILIGLLSMLAAGIPFWVTGIPLEAKFPWDRTSLPFMLGACLIMTAILKWVLHPRFYPVGLCCLVSLTLGWHLMNAEVYREEWDHLKSFYWQLTWRAPGLEPGTVIMSDQIPLYKISDSGMTAPLNWTYAPDYHDRSLPYKVFDLDIRLDGNNVGLEKLEKGVPVTHDFRTLFFTSDTDHALVFLDKRESCLHILSPLDANVEGLPNKVLRTLPLSNLDLIVTNPARAAVPPSAVFGSEPQHNWCYFYQKADLARQQKEWGTVMEMWNQSQVGSWETKDLFELIPFIEGAAHQKDFELAENLSVRVSQNIDLRNRLCESWNQISASGDLSSEVEKILSIRRKIDCNPSE